MKLGRAVLHTIYSAYSSKVLINRLYILIIDQKRFVDQKNNDFYIL